MYRFLSMSFTSAELRSYLLQNFMGSQIQVEPDTKELDESYPSIEMIPSPEPTVREPDQKTLQKDSLSRIFSIEQAGYKLHLVVYRENKDLPRPFLEYMFVQGAGGIYSFPESQLQAREFEKIQLAQTNILPTTEAEADDGDEDEFQTEFENQCSQFYQQVLGIAPIENDMGFIVDDDSGSLFVVYDASKIDSIENLEHQWVLVDDILQKKASFAEYVPALFLNHSALRGDAVRPITVYLCQENVIETTSVFPGEHATYINAYYDDPKDSHSVMSVIQPRIEHPILGDVFLFSREPLTDVNVHQIKRFALYLENNHDIGENPTDVDLFETYDTILLQENGRQFIGTQNLDLFTELE